MEHHAEKICFLSRYGIHEQFDLAAEFKPMLELISKDRQVLHISFRSKGGHALIPAGVDVMEMKPAVDRDRPHDVILKSLLFYVMLPYAALKIRRFKPDLIYVTEILPLCALFTKWMCRCKVATAYGDWHVHNFLGKKWWIKPFLRLAEGLERFEARHLDGLFCRATAAKTRLASWGVSSDKIRVVFDAPDLSAFYPQDASALREQCGFKPDDVVLLYHGIMHQGKGLDQLIRHTAALHSSDPRVGLIMVGSGPEMDTLKTLAHSLNIANRVYFTGWLKTIHEVGRYCNAADINIAMRTGDESNVHIIPGALLHSMACRKVVIGPDLPGIREVLQPGLNGFVFKPDDADSFVSLIRNLILQRGEWPRIAARAEQDIHDRFSVPSAAKGYAGALIHFATYGGK